MQQQRVAQAQVVAQAVRAVGDGAVEVEDGGALSPDMLSELWEELTAKYFGPELRLDDLSTIKWSRVPHFYMNYYVYQYATSYCASAAILEKFLRKTWGTPKANLDTPWAGPEASK